MEDKADMLVLFGRQSGTRRRTVSRLTGASLHARANTAEAAGFMKHENGGRADDAVPLVRRITNTREKPSGHLEVTVIDCVALNRSRQDTKAQSRQ